VPAAWRLGREEIVRPRRHGPALLRGPSASPLDRLGFRMRSARPVALLLVVVACTQAPPPPAAPPSQLVTLESGKVVRILRITKQYFTSGEVALMLSYETKTPLEDKVALGKESDELWKRFKFDVEAAHLTDAFIDANAKPIGIGFITTNRSFHFQYKLGSNGQWSRVN
jgi:hypothetical protein